MRHIATLDLPLPFEPGTSYPTTWWQHDATPERTAGVLRVRVELPPEVDLTDPEASDGELVVTTAAEVELVETPPAGGIFGKPADLDPELRAMSELHDVLADLDEHGRARVLAWAADRYGYQAS